MNLTVTELDNGVKSVSLKGRMDIDGVQEIDTRLAAVVATEKSKVILDLSLVEFMSSIGIGVVMRSANALKRRGGKIVLLNPQPVVRLILESSQIQTIIPIVTDIAAALETLAE